MIGYIPENIVIISGGEHKVKQNFWDDLSTTEDIIVTPAFVADSEKANTIVSGENWALAQTRSHHSICDKAEVKKEFIKNIPFSGIKIMSLVIRSGGGRAYKVVTKEGYYFDLREDILLDIMRNAGIEKGAELNGEYIWARLGSSMKIVRVGSDLHKELIVNSKRQTKSKIPTKDLVPGHIYRTKSGLTSVFLGVKNSITLDIINIRKNNSYYTYHNQVIGFELDVIENSKELMWLGLPSAKTYDSGINTTIEERIKSLYNIHFSKTHNYVEDVFAAELPKGWLEKIKQESADSIASKIYADKVAHSCVGLDLRARPRQVDTDYRYCTIYKYLFKTLTVCDSEPTIPKDFEEFLIYSKTYKAAQ